MIPNESFDNLPKLTLRIIITSGKPYKLLNVTIYNCIESILMLQKSYSKKIIL